VDKMLEEFGSGSFCAPRHWLYAFNASAVHWTVFLDDQQGRSKLFKDVSPQYCVLFTLFHGYFTSWVGSATSLSGPRWLEEGVEFTHTELSGIIYKFRLEFFPQSVLVRKIQITNMTQNKFDLMGYFICLV
jgi:hypothetical protein